MQNRRVCDACESEVHVSGCGTANRLWCKTCVARTAFTHSVASAGIFGLSLLRSNSVTEGVSFSCVKFVSQFQHFVSVKGFVTRPSLILIVTVEAAILRGTCNVTKLQHCPGGDLQPRFLEHYTY